MLVDLFNLHGRLFALRSISMVVGHGHDLGLCLQDWVGVECSMEG
jgi:hypothetical protein